jgi:hypothetical protein
MLKSPEQAISELVDCSISDALSMLETGFPATIVEYDNQIATVKPVMNKRFTDGDTAEIGELYNVPVIFPSGGGGILSFPVAVGDPVWVQSASTSIDTWKDTYSLNTTPVIKRRHSINDVVCFPCLYPKNIRLGANNENIELIFNKINTSTETREVEEVLSSIKMLPDGKVEVKTKNMHNMVFNPDKSYVIENTETGSKIHSLPDGNLEITTANTIKLQNSSEELVSLCSELMQLLIDATTNTQIGPMPLNNKAQIISLKSRLDTLKG